MTKTLVITPPFLESFRPPISGALICSIAASAGHDVTAWDFNIRLFKEAGRDRFYDMTLQFNDLKDVKTEDQQLVNDMMSGYDFEGYDYILISIFSDYTIRCTKLLLEHLRRKGVKAKIVLGGPGVELNRDVTVGKKFGESMLAEGLCDHYVVGEGEIALLGIFKGNFSYPGIDGSLPEQIDDIDGLPFPDYDYYDMSDYSYLDPSMPDLFIYGSRGCVRKCTFCDVVHYWPKFRYRSGKSIASELIANWEKYGVKSFFFTDSLINGSLKAFRELHETLARTPGLPKLNIGGFAIIRPKNQHPAELFDMMANNGYHSWSVGVEHGSDAMREAMKKKFTNDDIDWHLEQSERIGLRNHWLLMPTYIDEKLEHHQEYLDSFQRWKRYVASGTIASSTIAPMLMVLGNTPLSTEYQGMEYIDPNNDQLRTLLWMSRDNPELDLRERFRRAAAIYQAAIDNRWPISEAQHKLLTMESMIKRLKDMGLFKKSST